MLNMSTSVFTTNTADIGGGLRSAQNSEADIDSCTFNGNTATTHGAGIDLRSDTVTKITNTDIYENVAGDTGGGVFLSACDVDIASSFIDNNLAKEGGGVYGSYGSTIAFQNNDVANNEATLYGGGIYLIFGSIAAISNVTIKNNTALDGGGLSLATSDTNIADSTIIHNIAVSPSFFFFFI
jgi:predicted outer membrane repeat protein